MTGQLRMQVAAACNNKLSQLLADPGAQVTQVTQVTHEKVLPHDLISRSDKLPCCL
jgi:hypothetical protein